MEDSGEESVFHRNVVMLAGQTSISSKPSNLNIAHITHIKVCQVSHIALLYLPNLGLSSIFVIKKYQKVPINSNKFVKRFKKV